LISVIVELLHERTPFFADVGSGVGIDQSAVPSHFQCSGEHLQRDGFFAGDSVLQGPLFR
jgi:hypothetical protein